ncbi:bifunctional diguanylate cyclase/phosphodiesterase [Rhodobacter sp. KR11]|nr:bifunctional diguanylate cyclase/phosphodiesterase [Rhodobacter sp. KR11]MCW1920454.1 bifunctional diguanylate cyclase/phosphodiesterase [Rhodobacter sp. KR11]
MMMSFGFGRRAANWGLLRLSAVSVILRRPEIMVFVPAVTLGAFWMGGERALMLVALGAPLVAALAGAFRQVQVGQMTLPDTLNGLALRPQIIGLMDKILRDTPITGLTTGCLVVQFDDMEEVVDRYGRIAQTEVLTRCAERLCSALRTGDVVARLEGGGFAVALGPVRRLDLETAVQMAARLQSALTSPISLNGARVYVTVSVGFCLAERAPVANGAALLDAAQIAADDATRNGPGAIRAYAPDMSRTRADRDAMREELEQALDEGQIRAHFQPQISTDTGAVSGFESLARWHHPTRGLIPPAEFLPLIDDCGLSSRLCEVMVFNALSALSQWDKAGFHVPTVAVNFSKAELRAPGLASKLRWELDRFDLQPERLTIEILETVVAETDSDVIVSNIAAIAQMGCGVDLDDFGTGHASITSIRRFAVGRLKIDRSFVTRVDEDREQQKIVSAILSMAERLEMETIAEGVETQGEHAMLSQLGCNHVQGYGLARPMAFEETVEWMHRYTQRQTTTPRIGNRTN